MSTSLQRDPNMSVDMTGEAVKVLTLNHGGTTTNIRVLEERRRSATVNLRDLTDFINTAAADTTIETLSPA